MATSQSSWRWNAVLLLFAALSLQSVSAQSYSGCYSSSGDLVNEGYWAFQSEGYCQPLCSGKGAAVYGLSDASYCWCGKELPAVSSLVSSSNCNMNCTGYPGNLCGGAGYWSVWLTGLSPTVGHVGASSTSTSSSQGNGQSSQASVITSVKPGATVVRTVTGSGSSSSQTGTSTPSGGSSGGGSSVAAVAAGVTVGIVGLAAVVGGIFFYLRRRKQRHEEDEYQRQNQVSNFIRGGDGKPSMTGYSQMSDQRLDPEAGNRRNSHGSIADNQDYSRRILRVANPDST